VAQYFDHTVAGWSGEWYHCDRPPVYSTSYYIPGFDSSDHSTMGTSDITTLSGVARRRGTVFGG